MSLLTLLQKVKSLPKYLHQHAIKSIGTKWRKERPLVEDVLSGRTTFEKAITPLVEENTKLTYFSCYDGVCNSEQFDGIVKDCKEKFADILDMEFYEYFGRGGLQTYDLTETVDFTKIFWAEVTFSLKLIAMALIISFVMMGCAEGSIFTPWNIVKSLLTVISVGFGLLAIVVRLFFVYPNSLSGRRMYAKKVLKDAQFLDEMFRLAQNTEGGENGIK
ncbi:MAG: hypothetical protein WC819_04405 [Parcubacteria group bacterium]|jgi:hypothetical protein